MSQSDTAEAQAAHREYLAEVQRLVTEQVEVLFRTVTAAAERESPAAQPAGVTRDEHALTVSTGGRSAVFRIEAITDLPEGADRANDFETGQARCTVRGADGSTDVWVLHRLDWQHLIEWLARCIVGV